MLKSIYNQSFYSRHSPDNMRLVGQFNHPKTSTQPDRAMSDFIVFFVILGPVCLFVSSFFDSGSDAKKVCLVLGQLICGIFIGGIIIQALTSYETLSFWGSIFQLVLVFFVFFGIARYIWAKSENKPIIPESLVNFIKFLSLPERQGVYSFDFFSVWRSIILALVWGLLTLSLKNIFYAYLLFINAFTIWAFYYDKKISIQNANYEFRTSKNNTDFFNDPRILRQDRIPEIVLHRHSLYGGGLGAIIAMHFFRHKTTKKEFYVMSIGGMLVDIFAFYYIGFV